MWSKLETFTLRYLSDETLKLKSLFHSKVERWEIFEINSI